MAGGLSFTAVESTKLATAEIYGKTLSALGDENPNVVALTADLAGSTKIGDFKEKHPDRFFNVGIAEQNMYGVAAGMAKCGLIPFASSFSVFASLRALDQVHTDICYQNVNVKIIGTHGGTSFGQAGSTHHAIEDFAVVRGLVNMTLICPADGIETALAVRAAANTPGPFYIRINRGFDNTVYSTSDYGFQVGKAVTMNEGNDVTIIACGSCVYQSMQAAKILENDYNISARVLNMHTIKPLDKEAVLKAVDETRRVVTAEDHTIIGGLGSAVAETIVESGKGCAFKRLGIPDKFSAIGLHEDLLAMHEIDAAGIVKNVLELMKADFEAEAVKKGLDITKLNFGTAEDWTDEV
ncbi:MAG TPA: transketolase C-terminal domain-containing protein [Eubacteriales bacterium]|jgi:transketolase|nr:transketolase C-terminal domain-containing protein [Clostridia bacterium]HRR89990.1 transketolase C-terminal domain-containing protein [Eubacteriales bacterium]HRU83758.1 transketolase C-terminal domain-containing protein [Eubacteriales bacterium]